MSDLAHEGNLSAVAPSRVGATMDANRARAFSIQNVLIPCVLAAMVLVLPIRISMTERLLVSGALSLAVIAAILLARFASREWAVLASSCVKVTTGIVIVAAVPELFPAVLVYITTSVIATAVVQPRADAIYLSFGSATALSIIAVLRSQHDWFLALIVLAIVSLTTRTWAMHWRAQRIATRQRFDDLIDSTNLFFWEADAETGALISIKGNTMGTLGYEPHEILEMPWDEFIEPDERERIMRHLARGIAPGQRIDSMLSYRHRDGHLVTLRQMVRAGHNGTLIGSATDITSLHEATKILRHQAEHDMLTNLPNRLKFQTELDNLLADKSAGLGVGLVLMDLDGFKEINDTLGHNIGDEVLKILADRFRNSLDEAVLSARIGGDEFAALVVDDVDKIDERRMISFAKELTELVDSPLKIGGLRLVVRASAGIAIAPEHAESGEVLLQRADIAMYQAKASVDPVVLYTPAPHAHSVERLQLSARIGDALANGEFELWFQPKVDLGTGEVVGVEGLARWRHPELGVLAPNRFLSLLGVAGEYQTFTNQMVSNGIDFLLECQQAGKSLGVAVNLGAVSFLDRELPDRIRGMIDLQGIDPSLLILEVTEEEIQMDRDTSVNVFERLEELGLRLSIDDFGTGYSSLARLRSLRIEELKIDRSFVSGVTSDPEDRAIISAILGLAKQLNQTTVAEGIETEDQLVALQALGCEIGQGYLFAKPMPMPELLALLEAGSLSYSQMPQFARQLAP